MFNSMVDLKVLLEANKPTLEAAHAMSIPAQEVGGITIDKASARTARASNTVTDASA